jgi:hypothetical protein
VVGSPGAAGAAGSGVGTVAGSGALVGAGRGALVATDPGALVATGALVTPGAEVAPTTAAVVGAMVGMPITVGCPCGLGRGPVDMGRLQPEARTTTAATAKNNAMRRFINCLLV